MDNMLEAEIWTITRQTRGNAIVLRLTGSEIGIPIFVDALEAQSILIGSGEKVPVPPFMPDLFLELANRMELVLFCIEIHDIRQNILYGRMLFSGKEYSEQKPLILNGRPADAVALAVRSKCSVYVAQKVVNQLGVPIDMFVDEVPETGFHVSNIIPFVKNEVVIAEEYE